MVNFDDYFSRVLLSCKAEVVSYGACMSKNLDALDKDVCRKEFAALKVCSEGSLLRQRDERRQ